MTDVVLLSLFLNQFLLNLSDKSTGEIMSCVLILLCLGKSESSNMNKYNIISNQHIFVTAALRQDATAQVMSVENTHGTEGWQYLRARAKTKNSKSEVNKLPPYRSLPSSALGCPLAKKRKLQEAEENQPASKKKPNPLKLAMDDGFNAESDTSSETETKDEGAESEEETADKEVDAIETTPTSEAVTGGLMSINPLHISHVRWVLSLIYMCSCFLS